MNFVMSICSTVFLFFRCEEETISNSTNNVINETSMKFCWNLEYTNF